MFVIMVTRFDLIFLELSTYLETKFLLLLLLLSLLLLYDRFIYVSCFFSGIWFFQHVGFQFQVFYSSNTCLLVGYTSCCGGWLENCPSKWNVFPPQCTMQLPYLDRHLYLYVNTGKYSYAYTVRTWLLFHAPLKERLEWRTRKRANWKTKAETLGVVEDDLWRRKNVRCAYYKLFSTWQNF